MIPDAIRPALSRVVGGVVAAGVSSVVRHWFGHELTEEMKGHVAEIGWFAALSVYAVVYPIIHKTLGAKVNPTDAASPKLAAVATGPMGDGQRTQLAQTMDHAATTGAPLPPPPAGGP